MKADHMHTSKNENSICQKLVDKADRFYQMGQYDLAVDLLVAAIKQYPAEKGLYIKLSTILIDSDQFKDALDILHQMPGDEGDSIKLELSGFCELGLGHCADAERIADCILSAEDESAPALNLKGDLAYRRGDKREAEEYFLKASLAAPDYGAPITNLGRLKQEGNLGSAALDLYEKGFMLSPGAKDTALAYHSVITSQKAYNRAELVFEGVLRIHPLNKRLVYLFIDILLQQSKFEKAMIEIEKAMALFGLEDGILSAALQIRDKLCLMEIGGFPENTGSVSLCMITKNEEKYLAKCLRSVKPIVDEIIIVDTGSEDRTKEIAVAFGAKVFDFKWENNFAKARNYSLDKAVGDWILVLDADEVIAPCDYEGFRKLIRNAIDRDVAFSIETRNYTALANTIGWNANSGRYANEEAGTGWFSSVKVRLFSNDPNIRFEFPVHEMVDPCLKRMGIGIETTKIPVHHYGKLDQQNQADKGQTYYDIGIKKLDQMGNDISALRELAVQAGNLEKWEEAIQLWQRLIRLQADSPGAYINMCTAHWQLGQYEKALWCAQKAIALQPDLKEAHFNYAINLLHLGDAVKAISVLEKLLEQHPQYIAARFMLTAAYCCAGNKGRALEGCKQIQRTEIGPVLAVSFHDLAKRLVAANAIDYAIALLETAIECKSADENVRNLLNSCRQQVNANQHYRLHG
jgi:tetratricopeptide (TPR) repeat protein